MTHTMVQFYKKYRRIFYVLILVTFGCLTYCWYTSGEKIIDFNYAQDMTEVKAIFDKDLYWLSADQDYTPDYTFKYRTPHDQLSTAGQLDIKVLKEGSRFIGFVTYYMEHYAIGRVQFVAIKEEYRGKRYGQKLLEYALKNLKNLGAKIIVITTRPQNIRGLALYKRVGFIERSRDQKYVHLYYPVVK